MLHKLHSSSTPAATKHWLGSPAAIMLIAHAFHLRLDPFPPSVGPCLACCPQMERRMGRISDPLRLAVARQILQRGLATNPDSGCLAQVRALTHTPHVTDIDSTPFSARGSSMQEHPARLLLARQQQHTHSHSKAPLSRPCMSLALLLLLLQAWGLMELQKGNFWAAVRLLERSVVMEPFLAPVLRWKPVSAARKTIAGSSRCVTGACTLQDRRCKEGAGMQQVVAL